ncbi:MAG: hypothetical protein KAS32_17085 [Candidatus Peribacteraceae bacterium]|nr:hypothetical protein [Candidatus Peribacteraceae bacterium]
MRLLLATVLLLTCLGLSDPFVDPYTSAERVFDIPIGAKYGLTPHTDTMHVTTSEQGWALATECVGFTLINPNANFILWRLSNEAGTIQAYLGNYGTLELYPPGMIKSGSGIDSLFMDGEANLTAYIVYWSLD